MKEIIFSLQGEEINIHKASRFHGWLMEQIEDTFAAKLHAENVRPFSQYLKRNGEEWEWHICTLTEEADQKIAAPILSQNIQEIKLKNQKSPIKILRKQCKDENIEILLKKTYFQDSPRICHINFVTPVSFKRQGKYLIFPEVRLIFQSLLARFQACDFSVTLGGAETLEEAIKQVEIIEYQLRSRKFYLENTAVKGFQGRIVMKVNGPQMFVNVINLLLNFGRYSGVGIKTALGMGAMEIR